LVAVVVRSVAWSSFLVEGWAGAGGGGGPGLVRHGPRLLPAGRALVPRPPRATGGSGPTGRRPGQGPPAAVPQGREERSAASTAAPLRRAAARWQPDWQATGRSASGVRGPRARRRRRGRSAPRAYGEYRPGRGPGGRHDVPACRRGR